jgi:hypothetical protein
MYRSIPVPVLLARSQSNQWRLAAIIMADHHAFWEDTSAWVKANPIQPSLPFSGLAQANQKERVKNTCFLTGLVAALKHH